MSKKPAAADDVRLGDARTRRQVDELRIENDRLIAQNREFEHARDRLEREVGMVRKELDRERIARITLAANVAAVEAENRRLLDHSAQVEHLNANLASLYVAAHQLNESLDHDRVLATIEEIVVNMVGSEEFAIFERSVQGPFRVASSFGLSPERVSGIDLNSGPVADAIERGRTFVAPNGRPAKHALACVALKVANQVVGAIVILRLLSHKSALEALDHELFELLEKQAAVALYASSLYSRVQANGHGTR